VDFQAAVLTFESKKKRRPGLYRAVPAPATLLDALDLVHGLRDRATRTQLWTWSLKTAYTRVVEVMARAGIAGPQASPKGLRHGFGVACIEKGIPLNLVQRWLGHAQLSTTAIYADAVGEEERHIAARLWSSHAATSWERFFRGGMQQLVTDSQVERRLWWPCSA
jgi:integrase